MDLSQEELESLSELMVSDYWPVVQKIVQFPVTKMETAVISYDLSQGVDGLVRRKAQLDGARAVAAFIEQLKRKRKKDEEKK